MTEERSSLPALRNAVAMLAEDPAYADTHERLAAYVKRREERQADPPPASDGVEPDKR